MENFIAKVPEPTEAEVRAVLRHLQGRPARPLAADSRLQGPPPGPGRDPLDRRQALARGHQGPAHRSRAADRLREPQDGVRDSTPAGRPCPADLFAGQPELTPPVIRPFEEVRSDLAVVAGRGEGPGRDRREVRPDQARRPRQVLRRIPGRARRRGGGQRREGSSPGAVAEAQRPERHGEARGPRLRVDADACPRGCREADGQISDSRVGLGRRARAAAAGSSPRSSSTPRPDYSSRSSSPTRWARGTSPARSRTSRPGCRPLDEVRSQVVLAWKIDKARPLAQKAADQLAEQLKKKPGDVKIGTFQGYRS